LNDGHKVKITIMFRGREMSHPDLGKQILDRVAEKVAVAGRVESAPKLDGRNMVMVLGPDKRAQQVAHTASAEQAAAAAAEETAPAEATAPPEATTEPTAPAAPEQPEAPEES
jgi:translation initiation factor IF-3